MIVSIAALLISNPVDLTPWPAEASCQDGVVSGTAFVEHLLSTPDILAPAYRFQFDQSAYATKVQAGYERYVQSLPESERPPGLGGGSSDQITRACDAPESIANGNLCRVGQAMVVLEYTLLNANASSFHIETANGRDVTHTNDTPAARRALGQTLRSLFTSPQDFQVRCAPAATPDQTTTARNTQTPSTPAQTPQSGFDWESTGLVLTGSIADLSQTQFSKRSFATYTFTDEVRNDSEIWDITAVLGYNLRGLPRGGLPRFDQIDLTPFLSVRRKAGDLTNPTDELNEFSLGLNGAFLYQPEPDSWLGTQLFKANVRYITDDSFDARGVQASGSYVLPLWDAHGYRYWASLDGSPWQINWSADALFEAVWIDNPGATFPSSLSDNRRVGADATFSLRYVSEGLPFVPSVNLGYSVRDDLDSSGAADASLFKGSLALAPNDESNYQISVEYLTGQDLTKLTEQQRWQLVFGVRY